MEPDYLPIPEIFVSAVFIPHEDCTPFHDGGVWGGLPPKYCRRGVPPLVGVRGNAPEKKILGKCHVKVNAPEGNFDSELSQVVWVLEHVFG